MNTLEVDSVRKTYNHKTILSDVYLMCRTGEIIGMLGRNGCGKSTLLKIICGLTAADNKFIRVNATIKTKTAQLLKEVAYLSQIDYIPRHLAVKTVLSLSLNEKERSSLLKDPNVESFLDLEINQLSAGELRYLEIMLVLRSDTKFALLDEPYNGLSPLMAEKVNAEILKSSKTKGIIITDHNYRLVLDIATDVVLLNSGKLHRMDHPDDIYKHGYLPVISNS